MDGVIEILRESGILSILCIGSVFGVLGVIVNVFSKKSDKLALGKNVSDKDMSAGVRTISTGAGNNDQIIAAISAAVNEYRKSR